MTHDDSKIKVKSSQTHSISRENRSINFNLEKSLIDLKHEEQLVNRREIFHSVIPAAGKALTEILRAVGTTLGHVIEESNQPK